ncbi:MAG: DUF3179 domain-containing protein [Chloroflexi bacterium]|nr:DUF3179 domain-containing protein [Chloroflexota bacterium]
MSVNFKGSLFMLGLTAVAVVGISCASSPAAAPTPEITPAQSTTDSSAMPDPPTVVAIAETTEEKPTPALAPTPGTYDPQQIMYELFPGWSLVSPRLDQALDEIRANQDNSQVPIMVEILRYMPSVNTREKIGSALRDVTGQTFSSDDWTGWMEWLGKNRAEYQPPDGYIDWKSTLMQALDTRFALFLRPAREFSRIDVTEIVWGGVLPDGIPDLRNPKMLSPADADYLNPTDRVFGVTINGESRAYPLRIVNAHEMVNDTVGGEPITLMW